MTITVSSVVADSQAGLDHSPSFRFFRYRDFNPTTRRLKYRRIGDPNKAMRELHRRFAGHLQDLEVFVDFSYATGFRSGSAAVKNVLIHRRQRYFYLTDIHDAYGSVNGVELAKLLCALITKQRRPDGDLSVLLEGVEEVGAMLTFLRGNFLNSNDGLIVGAPCSPTLFNLFAAVKLDVPLAEYCARHDIRYTRYADDLTFSCRTKPIGKVIRRKIQAIIAEAGFSLSHRKSLVREVHPGQSIEINGVGLRDNGQIYLPRHYRDRIENFMRKIELRWAELEALPIKEREPQKIEELNSWHRRLNGMMARFREVSKERRLTLYPSEQRLLNRYRALRIKSGFQTRLDGGSLRRKRIRARK